MVVQEASDLFELGKFREAIELLKMGLQNDRTEAEIPALEPDHYHSLNNMGLALHDLGAMPESEECLKQAWSIAPDVVDAPWNLQGNANNRDEARYWISKHAEIGEENARCIEAELNI